MSSKVQEGEHKFYIGQRVSFEGSLCTVRYIGPVKNTKGDWLGVEWDDAARGKHNGSANGESYFICKGLILLIRAMLTLMLDRQKQL